MYWRGLSPLKVSLLILILEKHGVGGRSRNGQSIFSIGSTPGMWINLYNDYKHCCCVTDSEFLWWFKLPRDSFGDLKLQNPENRAFAQMFQKHYAGKILECHLNLLNVIRVGGYLPDRVINLILQYLSNRWAYFAVSFWHPASLNH